MTFKPKLWYPIAAVLSAVNVVAVWFAARPAEPTHAALHAALGVAFALWAQKLRRQLHASAGEPRVEALEYEMDDLRRELAEAQERIDFAERLLSQEPARREEQPR